MTCTNLEAPGSAVYLPMERSAPFFKALALFVLLDIILLFWLLNPLAHLGHHQRAALPMTPADFTLASDRGHVDAPKPSPIGTPVRREMALAKAPAASQ